MPPLPIAPSTASHVSHSSYACPSCGTDQQRLALLQEHVSLESQLLNEDKRNFKRRLKAAKATARKTQVRAENQLILAEKQMKDCEQKLKASREEMEGYHHKIEQLTRDKERLLFEQQQERQLERQPRRLSPSHALPSANESKSVIHGILESVAMEVNKNHEHATLVQELEEKQAAIDGLEMQLLDLEGELDRLRLQDDGRGHDDADNEHGVCLDCQRLQTKLARVQQQERKMAEIVQQQQQQLLQQERQQLQANSQYAEDAVKDLERTLAEQREVAKQLEVENAALLEKLVQQQRLDEPEAVVPASEPTLVSGGDDTVLTLETEADTIISSLANSPPRQEEDGDDDVVHELQTIQESYDASPIPPVRCLSAHPVPRSAETFLVFEKEYHGEDLVGMYTGYMTTDALSNENIPHGFGTLRLDDGAVMDGTWEFGLLKGSGVLATIDGDVYHGDWLQGKKHGTGTLVYSDGRVYRGSFEADKRHGIGYITWPYGAYYQGEFLRDKRNGSGEYRYADGRYYTGMYQDDRPHGYGVLRARDGTVLYDGQWELGEFLGSNKN
jgi:hypothetical protein